MHKPLRTLWMAVALAIPAFVMTAPLQSAVAQTNARAALPDFADLAEQVGPSVVNIRTMEKVNTRVVQGQMDEDTLEFFRRFGFPLPNVPRQGPRPNRPQQEEEVPRGVGSGFIVSADGFILTNAHVVKGADEVFVTLTDKREFKAKIIGTDERSDVAVVKIEATGLPAVRVGDVSKLRVGEWVIAIGSPFGLENTVTSGIVSAKQRDTGDFLPLIQTDVAINPGNSGGPLLNMRGEVVGINSQIYSRSGGYMGISFAIPMDEAMRVSEQLRSIGRVSRGRIGVQIEAVTKEIADGIGLGKPQGALVRAVESGSPAEKAGVEAGDVIVKFDGKPIEKSIDLSRVVGATKPGAKSTVTVFRKGANKDLTVVVAEVEAETKPSARSNDKDDRSKAPSAQSLGLVVTDLTDAQKKELNQKFGVRVESATDVSARAGLRAGDVIVQLAGQEVSNAKEFDAVLSKADKSKPLAVMFRRGNWTQFVTIKPAR